MEKHHMIGQGDFIAVGVSGGADSVCLLLLLCELKQEYDLELCAVHINHGTAGKRSKTGNLWKTYAVGGRCRG